MTGRIFDEDGDPVIGATISILRVSRVGGRGLPGGYSSQSTNDLGVYRVSGLAAGDYVIGTQYKTAKCRPTTRRRPLTATSRPFSPAWRRSTPRDRFG